MPKPLLFNYKLFLSICIALSVLFLLACTEQPKTLEKHSRNINLPTNPSYDFSYKLHDIVIEDPYHWITSNDKQVNNWKLEQLELTQQYFNENTFKSLASSLPVDTLFHYDHPQKHFELFYYIKENIVTGNQHIARYNPALHKESILFDVEQPVTIVATALHQGGRYLALNIKTNEHYQWRIFDSFNKEFTSHKLPINNSYTPLEWLGASFAFIYSDKHKIIYTNLYRSKEYNYPIFDLTQHIESAQQWTVSATLDDDRQHLVITASPPEKTRDYVWLKSLSDAQHNSAISLTHEANAHFKYLTNIDNNYYFKTNLAAPRSRVISININQPSRKNWKEVIEQKNEVLVDAQLVNKKWLLEYLDNSNLTLVTSQLNGHNKKSIDINKKSKIAISSSFNKLTDLRTEIFSLESFSTPRSIYQYNPADLSLTRILPEIDHTVALQSEVAFYRSDDGSRIPISLIYQSNAKPKNSKTLLITNQGLGHTLIAEYRLLYSQWLSQGGVIAVAHIRGGGVYGDNWKNAVNNQKLNKSVQDIIAAAEWLIDKNYTQADKLSAFGEYYSAALFAQSSILHPELFSSLILKDGFYDYIDLMSQNTHQWKDHLSIEDNKNSIQWLLSESPYHTLSTNNYPAILFIDSKLPVSENYKMLAKWQNNQMIEKPIILLDLTTDEYSKNHELLIAEYALSFINAHQ